jgi:hypothetical protein
MSTNKIDTRVRINEHTVKFSILLNSFKIQKKTFHKRVEQKIDGVSDTHRENVLMEDAIILLYRCIHN